MMDEYQNFVFSKRIRNKSYGFDAVGISDKLFDFQRDITKWAVKKGRCALFLDTGLGKTHCQTEWARLIGGRSLIVAPLSVARQTVRLAKKITGTDVHYTRSNSDLIDGINITNYEIIERFDPKLFNSVVLDESSILKSIDGATRRLITQMFSETPYRLCCTATPAPNDDAEIGNHAEFLGVMKNNEMLATFFIHANKQIETIVEKESGGYSVLKQKESATKGQEWRLRNYARESFYKWIASWAMAVKSPSDLGYDSHDFKLPELVKETHWIGVDIVPDGGLFFSGLKGLGDRLNIRKNTVDRKLSCLKDLVNNGEQWVIWCGLNQESDLLKKEISDCVEISGSDDAEVKAQAIEDFQDGKARIIITKPKIAGFGLNFQNAHNMAFFGLSDSWEAFYQCIRREWRYGQKKPVNVHIILTTAEREIYDNVMRKEEMAMRMSTEMIKHIKNYEEMELKNMEEKIIVQDIGVVNKGKNWTAILGDSCQQLPKIESESIDVSVYSPPFADLYTYSASDYDLGNSKDWDEFFKHYNFIIREVLRVTKAGRISCVHTSDIAAMAMKDGFIGMKDFPGAVIQAHISAGWIYHGYAVVGKNPQSQAIRTKSKGLLFTQFRKDSSQSRPCILDRMLFFKKPGDCAVPVRPVENGEADNETWIDWAGGIWTGIHESDTLRYAEGRDVNDEKHICPLQLGTIERCIKLYSNPGELLLTPFLGIGSEAYQALNFGRKAIGIELKESYYNIAVKNLQYAEHEIHQPTLFDVAEVPA
jgi:DNA modification methylase